MAKQKLEANQESTKSKKPSQPSQKQKEQKPFVPPLPKRKGDINEGQGKSQKI